jgi:hypothetical protein
MEAKMAPVPPQPSVRTGPQGSLDAITIDDQNERPPTRKSHLEAVEIVADGKIAVTRIRMPFIFRVLLALTGVRV